jgi:TatA/E family protein of Tat protein translocase
MSILSPIHIAFFAAVALLVLGPKRFPEFARALGNGVREFRAVMNGTSIRTGQPPAKGPELAASADAAAPEVAGAEALRD